MRLETNYRIHRKLASKILIFKKFLIRKIQASYHDILENIGIIRFNLKFNFFSKKKISVHLDLHFPNKLKFYLFLLDKHF